MLKAAAVIGYRGAAAGDMRSRQLTTDADLREEIADAIKADPDVPSTDVNVAVQAGVATLTGFVHSYFASLAAEQAARRVPGIQALANDIQVKPGREASDPEIARCAAGALREKPGLPHHAIQVTVRDGLLTLEGRVECYQQKRAAEDAVMTVLGARGVISRIEIGPFTG